MGWGNNFGQPGVDADNDNGDADNDDDADDGERGMIRARLVD